MRHPRVEGSQDHSALNPSSGGRSINDLPPDALLELYDRVQAAGPDRDVVVEALGREGFSDADLLLELPESDAA